MISGIRLKVCGLTSLEDARFAEGCGSDYLGFILYPGSPRHVTVEKFRTLASGLPSAKKVAVGVSPSLDELRGWAASGADFFQIHFPTSAPAETVRGWARAVPPGTLWFAPRLPPGTEVPDALLSLTKVFLLDTFHPTKLGGTGMTGDWDAFARHRLANPGHSWILSGGLNADNIAVALESSGADWVDVNSGVESAPGIKDHAKLAAFVRALK
jgi:phosphoribosylanthranilate isomerase